MDSDNGSHAVFDRIGREAAAVIGQRLFTVTAFDAAAMQVQRVYSSNPTAYPVGGRKPKLDTEFGRRVLIEMQPVTCEGDDAIARFFDDHEKIRGLGLHSSINAPVVDRDRCIGVLNFLMPGAQVTEDQLQAARRFASDPGAHAALAAVSSL